MRNTSASLLLLCASRLNQGKSESVAVETDPLAVRSRVVMMLVPGGRRPTALLRWTALVREGPRGRWLRVGAVKRVGRVEGVGWVMSVGGAVDGAGISPGYYLQRSQQGLGQL